MHNNRLVSFNAEHGLVLVETKSPVYCCFCRDVACNLHCAAFETLSQEGLFTRAICKRFGGCMGNFEYAKKRK